MYEVRRRFSLHNDPLNRNNIYIYIYSSTHTFTIHIESNSNLAFRKFPLVRFNDFFPNPGTISRRACLSTVFPFPLSPRNLIVHFRSWTLRVQRAIRFRLKKSIDAPPSVRSGIRREEDGEGTRSPGYLVTEIRYRMATRLPPPRFPFPSPPLSLLLLS